MTEKEKRKEYCKRWRQENKEKIKEYAKRWHQENKDSTREYHKKYREENKEKIKEYRKENKENFKKYYEENKEKIKEKQLKRQRTRRQQDTNYKISKNLRSRLSKAVKGINKSAGTMELLGCSVEQLREHLEAQFADGMSWDNYGYCGWHIDHIRPCASFDLTDPQQQLECFHYTNIQPLWAEENLKKGDKYD